MSRLEGALRWTLLFLAFIVVLRLLGLFLFDYYLPGVRGLRLPPFLGRVALAGAYVLTGLLIMPLVYPGLNLTPIVATSAVTSLVLGLALQPILGNFFAGLVISLERPFRINDWIRFREIEGRVVDITWRTTHLRTRENDNLVIPNGLIAAHEILNLYYPHPLHMLRILVGAHYRHPPYRVEKALLDAAARAPGVLESPTSNVFLKSFDDSAITYELRAWIEDIAQLPRIDSDVKRAIWEEFRRADLTIPFPIRTLEVEPQVNVVDVRHVDSERPDTAPSPRATLWVSEGPDYGSSFALGDTEVRVGRSAGCDFVLQARHVSKEHFRLEPGEDGYRLVDLASRGGTRVNGRRVEETPLRHLDRIAVGDTVIVYEYID